MINIDNLNIKTPLLLNGDCLELMKSIPDNSIDLILTDPPYQTTNISWDLAIPFEQMWLELTRIIKSNRAILLFGAEPFSSKLRLSNLPMFKYDLIWEKSKALGFQNAKNKPMNKHEIISVFSNGTCANGSSNKMLYNPQDLIKIDKKVSGIKRGIADSKGHKFGRANHLKERIQEYTNYPSSVLKFNSAGKTIHPTQKPVKLLEYLIKTYSNEYDTVLDFTAGVFSTGVACLNANRKFIGIERDLEYFNLGKARIINHLEEYKCK